MRVRITFKLQNRGSFLPFYHQHLFSQLIKGMLMTEKSPIFQNFNSYTFSSLKGLTRVSRQGLQYNSNRVSLVLASTDASFVDHIIGLFFGRKTLSVGSLILEPVFVERESEPEFGEVTKLICLSPIVPLEAMFQNEESKRFIEPTENEFSDFLFDSLINQLEEGGINIESIPDHQKFQLVPDENYLAKIKENGKKFSRVYALYDQDLRHEVRGYTIPFKLYAPPRIQKFIFNSGIGCYTNKGFGMVDLANVDPLSRTEPYMEKKVELVSA